MQWVKEYGSIFIIVLIVNGCGTSPKMQIERINIPPGLDSLTVAKSNQLAKHSFVSSGREKKAAHFRFEGKENLKKVDEFWSYLERQKREDFTLSSAQKAGFERAFSQGANYLNQWKLSTQNDASRKFSQQALQYCLQAQRYLEDALRINPFDKDARLLLATTYYNLQHIFGRQKNYDKAIHILERLTRLEKGEHALYRLLAENYLEAKNYEAVVSNFRRAEQVMLETSFLTPPDTSLLFYYVYGQADALVRLNRISRARQLFEKAKNYAKLPQEKNDVANYLKWIDWDGGNISASEQWDQILALERQRQYGKAAMGCQQLLPRLKTKNATLAVQHKLAIFEFEYLNRPEAGVERMRKIFEAASINKRENSPNQAIKSYLNTYGAMLYRLGIEARKKDQKKLSLAYFTKAASFQWDNVAKAYLEIVPLVWTTPERAIEYGRLALASNAGLSSKENCELMSLMVKAHKSAGRFDEARTFYEDWKNCQD